ncbi:MAG: hypothetical protein ICV68_00925 [Pyrinomonadaceae bacterium]|nr:hypothetical protein [Pyrinomonadaceae bacterium]
MAQQSNQINPVAASLAFASEIIVPGGSNLLRGNFLQAGVHCILGYAAKAAFGGPFMALISANSMVRALTGRHLSEHLEMAGIAPAPTPTSAPVRRPSTTGPTSTKARAARKRPASKK